MPYQVPQLLCCKTFSRFNPALCLCLADSMTCEPYFTLFCVLMLVCSADTCNSFVILQQIDWWLVVSEWGCILAFVSKCGDKRSGRTVVMAGVARLHAGNLPAD